MKSYKFLNRKREDIINNEKFLELLQKSYSSIIEDNSGVIEKYSMENKTGKQIIEIINTNGIQFEKLLKLCHIYNDWYLYST